MKRKQILLLFIATFALAFLSFNNLKSSKNAQEQYSSLIKQNIEALSQTPELQGYSIAPYDCTIDGVGQVKLGNGKIIKATAEGSITMSGARDCKFRGDYLCTPISCDQIYSTILN